MRSISTHTELREIGTLTLIRLARFPEADSVMTPVRAFLYLLQCAKPETTEHKNDFHPV